MTKADTTTETRDESTPPERVAGAEPPDPEREPAAETPPGPILEMSELPAGRRFSRRPVPMAHTALVFDTDEGRLIGLKRMPTLSEWRSAGLCRCYWVDMSDHHWTSPPLDLPTARIGLRFVAEVRFGWRVHDPVQVVQRGLADVHELGLRHLVGMLWPVARAFDPMAVAEAEVRLNRLIGQAPIRLEEGVLLFHCALRLDADPLLKEHQLTMVREQQQAELHDYRCAQVVEAVRQGQHALLARHLAQQPADVAGVVRLLAEQERTSLEAAREIVAQLLDRRLARDVDLEGIGLDEFGVEALRIVIKHLRTGASRALGDLAAADDVPGLPPVAGPAEPAPNGAEPEPAAP
ncbi:hypothetical protein [Streptoalloteichus hindustanus]|uniref:SPFH domain / Band 7 family protein n=1 Tax=Streptoalloteichus hindustanus TaxID=2017 RepID=A0A1M5GVG4_STRHI|nr:hypothetical protein [Streptoalloteichus hindustanus]SHG07754.1 hypothetical protein SAMN05444320_106287 [Streptoalloteichus hindustanus]